MPFPKTLDELRAANYIFDNCCPTDGQAEDIKMTYQVIDRQTGTIMGEYKTRRMALRIADRLDLMYGAIRYRVVSSEK